MRRWPIRAALLIMATVQVLASATLGDVIVLKSGRRLEGTTKDCGDSYYIVTQDGTHASVPKRLVQQFIAKPTMKPATGGERPAIQPPMSPKIPYDDDAKGKRGKKRDKQSGETPRALLKRLVSPGKPNTITVSGDGFVTSDEGLAAIKNFGAGTRSCERAVLDMVAAIRKADRFDVQTVRLRPTEPLDIRTIRRSYGKPEKTAKADDRDSEWQQYGWLRIKVTGGTPRTQKIEFLEVNLPGLRAGTTTTGTDEKTKDDKGRTSSAVSGSMYYTVEPGASGGLSVTIHNTPRGPYTINVEKPEGRWGMKGDYLKDLGFHASVIWVRRPSGRVEVETVKWGDKPVRARQGKKPNPDVPSPKKTKLSLAMVSKNPEAYIGQHVRWYGKFAGSKNGDVSYINNPDAATASDFAFFVVRYGSADKIPGGWTAMRNGWTTGTVSGSTKFGLAITDAGGRRTNRRVTVPLITDARLESE